MKKIEIEGYEGNDVGYMCVFCRLLLRILGTVDAMTALTTSSHVFRQSYSN
jgi:hypothetical protein